MYNGSMNTTTGSETSPQALLISLFFVSCLVILTNGLVLLCLVFNRHALKKNTNLQILSLSVTDTLLGATFIMLLTSFRNRKGYFFWSCTILWYPYLTATCASIYHTLSVCTHRLLSIKRMSANSEINICRKLVIQAASSWAIGLILVGIVFLSFGKPMSKITVCSLSTLFGDNYAKVLVILNVACVIPHIATNIIYLRILKFLLRKWNRVGTTHNRNAQANTYRQETNLPVDNIRKGNKEASTLRQGTSLTAKNIRQTNIVETKSRRDASLAIDYTHQLNDGASTSRSGVNLHQVNVRASTDINYLNKPERRTVDKEQKIYTEATSTRRDATFSDETLFTITGDNVENQLDEQRSHVTLKNVNEWHNASRRLNPVNHTNANAAEQRTVFITIGVLLITLNISIVPVLVMPLVDLLIDETPSQETKATMALMPLLNSLINPFIYFIRVKRFREALMHSFSNFCGMLGRLLHH